MTAINPITPRTTTVVILQGDDDAQLRQLDAELARIEKAKPKPGGTRLMSQPDPVQVWEDEKAAAEKARDDFATKAKKRGVTVILRALHRKTWREVVAKHPPREDEDKFPADARFGVNVDDFQEEVVPMCLASPAGTPEETAAFLDSLNEGQFGRLATEVYDLNMGQTVDPTPRLPSAGSRTSNATSS